MVGKLFSFVLKGDGVIDGVRRRVCCDLRARERGSLYICVSLCVYVRDSEVCVSDGVYICMADSKINLLLYKHLYRMFFWFCF